MSLGYAEKLSYRSDLGGQLGSPELFDGDAELSAKVGELAELMRASRRIMVFTGAGISTSCGIPDFRGPGGIWTLQRAGQPLPKPKVSFTFARPSLTHMALVALHESGKLAYVCSQNVDGLHLRSGIPRRALAELHGNCFAERCHKCGAEYIRDFEIETVGFKRTGRSCSTEGCAGRLRDHILDWEDALPPDELEASEAHASEADLTICLGTSLQITPACNLPLRTVKGGGKLVIVNLQKTPKDKSAHLLIRGRADEVMRGALQRLGMPVPPFVRRDRLILLFHQPPPRNSKHEAAPFSVSVCSAQGQRLPLPVLTSVAISFPDHPAVKGSTLRKAPFTITRSGPLPGVLRVQFDLQFAEGLGEEAPRSMQAQAEFKLLGATELKALGTAATGTAAPSGSAGCPFSTSHLLNAQFQELQVTTQSVDYSGGKREAEFDLKPETAAKRVKA